MDAEQKDVETMGAGVQSFITDNAGQYTGYTVMEDEKKNLDGIMKDWSIMNGLEENETTGVATDKNLKKTLAAFYWAKMASTTRGWALKGNRDADLATNMNYTEKEIVKMGDTEAETLMNLFNTTIAGNAVLMSDTGITTVLLDAGQKKTNAFGDTIGKPKEAIGDKSVVGVNIDKLIHERFYPCMEVMDGYVNGIYFIDMTDFVAGYTKRREIIGHATHPTTMEVTFIDSVTKKPIRFANLMLQKSGKTAISDAAGLAVLKTFKGGKDTDFDLSAKGYKSQLLTITIKMGKKIAMTIEMVAEV